MLCHWEVAVLERPSQPPEYPEDSWGRCYVLLAHEGPPQQEKGKQLLWVLMRQDGGIAQLVRSVDPDDREDVLSEGYTLVLKTFERAFGPDTFRGFVYNCVRTARRRKFDDYRSWRQHLRYTEERDDDELSDLQHPGPDPQEVAERHERAAAVDRAWARARQDATPTQHRNLDVVYRREVMAQTYEETAEAMRDQGITGREHARVCHHRGLEYLRPYILEELGQDEF